MTQTPPSSPGPSSQSPEPDQWRRYPPPPPSSAFGPSSHGYVQHGPSAPTPPVTTYSSHGTPLQGYSIPGGVPARPSAYWPLSIIALLFFPPAGAVGIYFSAQVTSRWNAGNIDGSRKASSTALIVGIVGIAIGLCFVGAALSSSGSGY